MKKFKFVAASLFAAVLFMGCDADIEAPIVWIDPCDRQAGSCTIITVQGKADNTIVEDVKVNRDNCPIKIKEYNNKKLEAYEENHPERVIRDKNGYYNTKLQDKNGNLLGVHGIIWSDAESLEYFNSLDDDSKSIYDDTNEDIKLNTDIAFGKKVAVTKARCAIDTVLEVELHTNGGVFSYDFTDKQLER